MSERAFVKVRVHRVDGRLWAKAECSHAHVPCSIDGELVQVAAWLASHLAEFHVPTEAPP